MLLVAACLICILCVWGFGLDVGFSFKGFGVVGDACVCSLAV